VEIYRQGYDLQLTRYDSRLARDVLHDRDGALADERDRHRMGAHAVARDAAGGVGDVEENERDKLHARVDVTTGALRPHACGVWSRHLWA
jgi:hypothetical protein